MAKLCHWKAVLQEFSTDIVALLLARFWGLAFRRRVTGS